MTKKILVAIYPGFIDTPAIQRTLALASVTDVDILLYSAVYDEYIPNLDVDAEEIQKMRQSMLDSEKVKLGKIKNRLEQIAKSVEIQAQWQNSVADGIREAAEKFNADLIIASSTRHATVTRLFLSNTDWEILRHVSTPVLFAHCHTDKPYKKIVVAVEPASKNNKPTALEDRMIAIGKWISDLSAGELHLAHAYPAQFTEISMEYMIPVELNNKLKQEHEEALYQLAAGHDISKQNAHFIDEYPRIAIPELAKDIGSDLVIMGIVSRSLIDRFLIGSTAEFLLDHLECDVLTVHADYNADT